MVWRFTGRQAPDLPLGAAQGRFGGQPAVHRRGLDRPHAQERAREDQAGRRLRRGRRDPRSATLGATAGAGAPGARAWRQGKPLSPFERRARRARRRRFDRSSRQPPRGGSREPSPARVTATGEPCRRARAPGAPAPAVAPDAARPVSDPNCGSRPSRAAPPPAARADTTPCPAR